MQKASNNTTAQKVLHSTYIESARANHRAKMFKNKLLTMVATGRQKLAEAVVDHYKSGKGELNRMTVIRAITGSGKTFAITKKLIPEMMEDGTEAIFLVSPDTGAYSNAEIRRMAIKNHYQFFETPDVVGKVEEYLRDCEVNEMQPRLIVFGHVCNIYNGLLVDMLLDHTTNIAFIQDECHLTLTSGYANYFYNNGTKPPKFSAAMYEAVCKISAVSPLVYGLTATPTPEMDVDYPNAQHIKPLGTMDFDIMDIGFTDMDRLWYVSFMDTVTRFDATNPDECRAMLEKALNYHFSRMNRLSNKNVDSNFDALAMSMIAFAAREKSKFGLTVDEMVQYMTDYCIRNNILDDDEEMLPFAVVKGDGTYQYRLTRNRKKAVKVTLGKTKDQTATRRKLYEGMDNIHHPISIMIVVEIANVGININSIKTIIDYRGNDTTGIKGEGLHGKPTQKAGRGSRKNYSIGQSARIDHEFDGNLNEFYNSLTQPEIRRHIEANTLKIFCPDTSMWDEALIQIAERAMLPVEEARAMIKSICGR